MTLLLEALLFSTLEFAPALVFGTMGAVLSERAGVVNVAVEGMMRAGAFCAALAALWVPTPLAVLLGAAAGAAVGGVHAVLCVSLRAEQIISGLALNIVVVAATSFVLESLFSPAGTPAITPLARLSLPVVRDVPVLQALSGHSPLTFLALLSPLLLHAWLRGTPAGLRVRAVGEKPEAVATLGGSVAALRAGCVVAAGALAGVGGASLSTATLDRFEHNMPAGLGFMAVAAMVFGRWTPLGGFGAALFFALANALRIGLASSLPGLMTFIPQGALLAAPYLLTLAVLVLRPRGASAPSALGRPYDAEARA